MKFCLDKIMLFLRVVESGSLLHAAKKLNINITTLSRQIAELEKNLQVQLFIHKGNSLGLTRDGKSLLEKLSPIMSEVIKNIQDFKIECIGVSGKLNIIIPSSLSFLILNESIAKFLVPYSNLHINIISTELNNLSPNVEYDLAITSQFPKLNHLFIKKVISMEFGLFATNNYINKQNNIKNINEIPTNNVINFINDDNHYLLKTSNNECYLSNSQITVHNIMHLVLLLQTDNYVGFIPKKMINLLHKTFNIKLQELPLDTDSILPLDIFLVKSTKHSSKIILMVADFIECCLKSINHT